MMKDDEPEDDPLEDNEGGKVGHFLIQIYLNHHISQNPFEQDKKVVIISILVDYLQCGSFTSFWHRFISTDSSAKC